MKDTHQVTAVAIIERIATACTCQANEIAANVPAAGNGRAIATSAIAPSQWMEEPSKLDLLASMDRSRQMMDRTTANGTITRAQVDNIERMVGLHARNCVIMPPLEMLSRLTADFDEIQALSSRIQPPRIHERLYAVAAQIGALIADEFMVLGEHA